MTSITLAPTELGKIAGPQVRISRLRMQTYEAQSKLPQLLGALLNWGFFGILSMQVYMYYLAFPNDRVGNKALVYTVYFLDAVHTFILTASAFRAYASGFGDFAALDKTDILWVSNIPTGLIAFLAQAFYGYRIAVFSQKKHLSVLIILLAFLSLGGSIATAVETKVAGQFSRLLTKRFSVVAWIWGGGSAACDVLIAASMTYYLKRCDSEFSQTHVFLTRTIRLTIETGSVTAAVAILCVILVFLPGQQTYYLTTVALVGKMYSNSMMASFNSRIKIGPSDGTVVSTSCEFRSAVKFYGPTALSDMDVEWSRSAHGRVQKIGDEVSLPPTSEISQVCV
ncbi:hypothetical protein GALMADRAFT_797410 [Galerina marginata CBS 339.88]|uniref:DUF6534 domain-containing protein n=1 Tax=Galerina marginata (strain CBS 339.88) TaxID=685588 RepID=A0A067SK36_GALM3|nr:hypothetical protein GALMADRAFT_797410 [Galerina marginata CBS 339.88]